MCAYTYMCIHVCMYVYLSVYTHACVHVGMYACMYTCISRYVTVSAVYRTGLKHSASQPLHGLLHSHAAGHCHVLRQAVVEPRAEAAH